MAENLRVAVLMGSDSDLPVMKKCLEQVAKSLGGLPVTCRQIVPQDPEGLPILEIEINETRLGRSAFEVCRRLRRGKPAVQVGHGKLADRVLVINPLHLNDARMAILAQRLREELS